MIGNAGSLAVMLLCARNLVACEARGEARSSSQRGESWCRGGESRG